MGKKILTWSSTNPHPGLTLFAVPRATLFASIAFVGCEPTPVRDLCLAQPIKRSAGLKVEMTGMGSKEVHSAPRINP
jgi:hypothetical protein